MIKLIWGLIGLNTFVLIIFVGSFFVLSQGRNVSYEEKGWTVILSGIMLLLILLAAIPLRISQGTGTLIFSGIIAFLPLILFIVFRFIK